MFKLDKSEEDRVLELHKKLPFVNASDMTSVVQLPTGQAHFDEKYIEKLRKGRVSIIHLSWLFWLFDNFYQSVKRIYGMYKVLDKYKDDLALITSYDSIEKAMVQGKIGVIMHSHNSSIIDDDVGLLSILHKLGLRVMQLTYQGSNLVAGGCAARSSYGLTSFGVKAISEMNRLGILIDLAHVGYATFMDTLEISKENVIYSHGGVHSLCETRKERNLTDEQIKALAEKDGVMGIMAKPNALNPRGREEGATISDYMRHLEYVVKLVGVDYVGIGTENAGWKTWEGAMKSGRVVLKEFIARFHDPKSPLLKLSIVPNSISEKAWSPAVVEMRDSAKGLEDVSKLKLNLIRGLVNSGYSDQEISKILGGNFLRVYRKIW
jgi:membrane dipeptidase